MNSVNRSAKLALLPDQVDNAQAQALGVARCPGPSVQEILQSDVHKAPAVLAHAHYEYLGSADIPYARYYSQEHFDREIEKIWKETWQWACREEHISELGDYYVYEVAHLSFLIVRTQTGAIKGYYNSCLHRGTKLRASEGVGAAEELRCPFHGWTWTLSGELNRVPCAWDFAHVEREKYRLPEVKVATWGGFVFINAGDNPPPLDEYLGIIPEHFARWDLAKRYVDIHLAKELPCNWKTAQEAFLESYHVLETHPQLLEGVGDANVQYDIYGNHVSRFVAASGVNSPHLTNPLSEKELLNKMLVGDRSVLGDDISLKESETARVVMARYLRKMLGQKYGADMSTFSDSEVIDTIEYHLFPNMIIFPGLSLPMVYRFRPLGADPTRTLFEILFLRPVPEHRERPAPSEMVMVKEHESYASVPGMDPALAAVYDQDTNIMRSQQQGFRASKKAGETLGNFQEIQIRHFEHTVDLYLKANANP